MDSSLNRPIAKRPLDRACTNGRLATTCARSIAAGMTSRRSGRSCAQRNASGDWRQTPIRVGWRVRRVPKFRSSRWRTVGPPRRTAPGSVDHPIGSGGRCPRRRFRARGYARRRPLAAGAEGERRGRRRGGQRNSVRSPDRDNRDCARDDAGSPDQLDVGCHDRHHGKGTHGRRDIGDHERRVGFGPAGTATSGDRRAGSPDDRRPSTGPLPSRSFRYRPRTPLQRASSRALTATSGLRRPMSMSWAGSHRKARLRSSTRSHSTASQRSSSSALTTTCGSPSPAPTRSGG